VGIERFDQLKVWQVAHALVLDIYRATRSFPEDERYGLGSQMRRSAVSVPANIAEGFKRRTNRDKRHFYNIAQASLEELRYYLRLGSDLGYGTGFDAMSAAADEVARLLHGLVRATSALGLEHTGEPGR